MAFYLFSKKYTIVDAFSLSHRGRIRKNNEDFCKIINPNPREKITETILALADGMGGYNKGEIASKLAVDYFLHFFFKSSEKKLAQKVADSIVLANKEIYKISSKDDDHYGMGSTLAVVVIYNEYAVIANVGDSRIYHLVDKNLIQLSEEHTWVNEVGLSPKEARIHPNRNVITRNIGKSNHVQPYVDVIKINEKDLFLLCSDGLTTHVSDRSIRQILDKPTTLKSKIFSLLKSALNKGGTDNITIVLASPLKINPSGKLKKSRRKRIISFIAIIILIAILIYSICDFLKPQNWLFPKKDIKADSLIRVDSLIQNSLSGGINDSINLFEDTNTNTVDSNLNIEQSESNSSDSVTVNKKNKHIIKTNKNFHKD